MARHLVYLGGFQPHAEILYLKAGMTSNVRERIKSYNGMLPGGLTFIYTAPVSSRLEALRVERKVLCSLGQCNEIQGVGGEWFKCDPFQRNVAFDLFIGAAPGALQIQVIPPIPFADGKRGSHRKFRR